MPFLPTLPTLPEAPGDRALSQHLARAVLVVHLGFVGWMIAGVLLTRERPVAARLHLACTAWGALITSATALTAGAIVCPLTRLEHRLLLQAGQPKTPAPLVLRCLPAGVQRHLPQPAQLRWGIAVAAIAVCAVSIVVYRNRAVRAGSGRA